MYLWPFDASFCTVDLNNEGALILRLSWTLVLLTPSSSTSSSNRRSFHVRTATAPSVRVSYNETRSLGSHVCTPAIRTFVVTRPNMTGTASWSTNARRGRAPDSPSAPWSWSCADGNVRTEDAVSDALSGVCTVSSVPSSKPWHRSERRATRSILSPTPISSKTSSMGRLITTEWS